MNIYLIRHSAVYNPNKLCYGQSEIPLEENFTADFDWIKDHLNVEDNTATYYASPFRRCSKLATFLSNDQYTMDPRLSELNFGTWEMMPWSAIPQDEINPWMEDFVNYQIPQGESFIDLYERSVEFLEDMIRKHSNDIVVVTHAGVIRSLTSYVLDFPLENAFNQQVDYSSITQISINVHQKSLKLEFLNFNPTISKPKRNLKD